MTGLPTMAHSGTSPGINGLASTIVTPTSGKGHKKVTSGKGHKMSRKSFVGLIHVCPSFIFISLHYNKFDQHLFVSGTFVHLTVTFAGGGEIEMLRSHSEKASFIAR